MIRLREFLRNKPRVSFVFAVTVGILVSEIDEVVQRLLLPVATSLQPQLLNADSSFYSVAAVNCIFQGLVALGVCLIAAPFFASALRPQSIFYPLIAVGADLIYSSWWIPISIYTNKWPFPSEFAPIYVLSAFLTSAIFFVALLFASKKTIQRRWFCFGSAPTAGDEKDQPCEAVGTVQVAIEKKNNLNLPSERLSTRDTLI